MAKIYNNFTSDTLMSFGKSFSRLNGQPLDKSEIYFDLDTAQSYARTDAAYVGQKIAVINSTAGTVVHYSIKNEAGDLEELGKTVVGDDLSVEVNGKTLSLKNWGKKYYKYVPATESTPATYELTDGFMDGLEVKVRKTTRTNAAGDPEEVYELAYYQPNPTTVEGLQSALTAVQEAAQSAKDDAAGALTEAQKKISDVKGEGAVEVAVDSSTKEATVKINLDNSGNVQFTETGAGLKADVEIPEQVDYTVAVTETTPEGYAKAYTFIQKGSTIATINIPKDMVVSSGKVVTNPEGQAEGTYIELTLANATSDKLYINVGDLIEYVTSGSATDDDIVIAVSADHKVTATLSDAIKESLLKADSAVQKVTVLGKELTDGDSLTVDEAKQALALSISDIDGLQDELDSKSTEEDINEAIAVALSWGNL